MKKENPPALFKLFKDFLKLQYLSLKIKSIIEERSSNWSEWNGVSLSFPNIFGKILKQVNTEPEKTI